ncbi:MAG TPA: hypothetical protein VFX26_02490 [Nitrososphaeraceae archaeon]|jgi:hypothetical protein|nr:hypothetical protein [Nitrososphaeraceae archaeon]
MNDLDKAMELQKIDSTPKMIIVYCTLAGLISAMLISGLLAVIDFASGTPSGTFFAVIGLSLGFNDPASAQYVGLGLHTLTGTVAGNIFGQIALFWRKLIPYNMKRGVSFGLLLGISLWAVLFAPLATFGIQPKLDTFMITEANTYAHSIANHFAGLYYFVLGASLLFHLVYGAIFGLLAGRMTGVKLSTRKLIDVRIKGN